MEKQSREKDGDPRLVENTSILKERGVACAQALERLLADHKAPASLDLSYQWRDFSKNWDFDFGKILRAEGIAVYDPRDPFDLRAILAFMEFDHHPYLSAIYWNAKHHIEHIANGGQWGTRFSGPCLIPDYVAASIGEAHSNEEREYLEAKQAYQYKAKVFVWSFVLWWQSNRQMAEAVNNEPPKSADDKPTPADKTAPLSFNELKRWPDLQLEIEPAGERGKITIARQKPMVVSRERLGLTPAQWGMLRRFARDAGCLSDLTPKDYTPLSRLNDTIAKIFPKTPGKAIMAGKAAFQVSLAGSKKELSIAKRAEGIARIITEQEIPLLNAQSTTKDAEDKSSWRDKYQ